MLSDASGKPEKPKQCNKGCCCNKASQVLGAHRLQRCDRANILKWVSSSEHNPTGGSGPQQRLSECKVLSSRTLGRAMEPVKAQNPLWHLLVALTPSVFPIVWHQQSLNYIAGPWKCGSMATFFSPSKTRTKADGSFPPNHTLPVGTGFYFAFPLPCSLHIATQLAGDHLDHFMFYGTSGCFWRLAGQAKVLCDRRHLTPRQILKCCRCAAWLKALDCQNAMTLQPLSAWGATWCSWAIVKAFWLSAVSRAHISAKPWPSDYLCLKLVQFVQASTHRVGSKRKTDIYISKSLKVYLQRAALVIPRVQRCPRAPQGW